MSRSAAFWDPFEGTVAPDNAQKSERTARLPESFKKLELPLFLLSVPGFILAIFSESLRPYGFALVTVGMAGGFAVEHFTGAAADRLNRIWSAADRLGFRFRPEIPAQRLAAIRRAVPELFSLRIFGSIPLIIESEMWGADPDGNGLWLGVGAISSATFLGGPKQNDRSAAGIAMGTVGAKDGGIQGNLVMMIAAYRLERDTGIRLVLMPETVGAVGPLDRDLKTESVAFNKAFNIRVTARDDGGDLDRISMNVLQVLTPAFQTTLLDLADRFAARVIVDRDIVYFGGYRNLQSLEDAVLRPFVEQAVAGFAEASVSFKRYAE